jgi:hypothetical protein
VDDGSTDAVRKFVGKMKPAFKVVHDPTQKGGAAYGVTGIPANYVIGRDGKLSAVVGFDLPALQQAATRVVSHGMARAGR